MPQDRNLSGCQVFEAVSLPAGWDCVPLGGRIELAYGRGLREEDRKPGDVDVYGANGRVGSHNVALVNGPGILIGRKGTVGAVHYVHGPFWPIDTVYYVVPWAGDEPKFLHRLLDYLPLKSLNAATGVPGLSRRDAYDLRGWFPPPHEQAAIARILTAIDETLELTHAAVARAKEARRAIVQRVLSEGLRHEPLRKTAIGLVPSSWDVVPVSSVVETFQYGLSVPMQIGGTLPILRMGNIQDGEVLLSDLKYVTLPMLFIHTPRVMRDRHLEHGLGEVNGDRCMLHLDSSSAVARRGRFTTGTMMPHQREESIPSLVR